MPINEAFFWFSLTMFGTGLYFLPEYHALAAVLIGLGLAGMAYSVWVHHNPSRKQPPLWVGLLLLTWAAIGYNYYDRQISKDLPTEDLQDRVGIVRYGEVPEFGSASCGIVVDGERFWPYHDHYKLAAGCFFWDGLGDVLDAPQLQVTKAVEIRKEQIPLSLRWGGVFEKHLRDEHVTKLNHVLMLLPRSVEPGEFDTLKQARAAGVKLMFRGAAPASVPLQ